MEYELFLRKIKEAVQELCGDGESVIITKVMRNNSLCHDAIVLKKDGAAITPAVYLDGYYEKYLRGTDIGTIADEILLINSMKPFIKEFPAEKLYDFDLVRDRIIYRLVNTGRNEILLETVPHREYFDMSIIYYIGMESGDENAFAAVPVRNGHMRLWGIDEEALYELASENTVRIFPTVIRKMSNLLDEIYYGNSYDAAAVKEDAAEDYGFEAKLYVASNGRTFFGASCMLDGNALYDFAKQKGDFYIIPSSIHEIILVPEETQTDGQKLLELVRDISEANGDFGNFLSDSLYKYDADNRSVIKINNINL